MNNVKSDILKVLKIIRRDGPNYEYHGICYNLDRGLIKSANYEESSARPNSLLPQQVDSIVNSLFVKWPKFSGDIRYPVPTPSYNGENIFSPKHMYEMCFNFWGTETEYGKLRWELLNFMIDELEKESENE